MTGTKHTGHPAVSWVPTLYLAEALPYTAVMVISVIMYKDLGLTDGQIAFYTSWLGLPWVVKPVWSSIVDNLRTKRWWILTMQYFLGCALALVAFSLQTHWWLQLSLALFMLVAFSSATHDISADGFYILALDEQEQSAFVGVRNTFYRVGMLVGQGALVLLVGFLAFNEMRMSWAIAFGVLAGIMLLLALSHTLTLPRGMEEERHQRFLLRQQLAELVETLKCLLTKPHLTSALAFILLFRLPEGMLAKMVPLFMKTAQAEGGLGMSNVEVGFVNGTLGVIGLLAGGIVGGLLVARYGLKRCLWPLVLCFTLPDLVYLFLSLHTDANLAVISACVSVEQFGYGMGFAAYTLFLIGFSRGERATAIFSICTAGQFLGGAVLPGMVSGWISDSVGYVTFFSIVMVLCLVTFAVTAAVRIRE